MIRSQGVKGARVHVKNLDLLPSGIVQMILKTVTIPKDLKAPLTKLDALNPRILEPSFMGEVIHGVQNECARKG